MWYESGAYKYLAMSSWGSEYLAMSSWGSEYLAMSSWGSECLAYLEVCRVACRVTADFGYLVHQRIITSEQRAVSVHT